jgi:hypothetical protein
MFLEIFGALLGLALLYVGYVCWCQTYWKRHGTYTLKSTFFLGSLGPALLRQKTLKDIILVISKLIIALFYPFLNC